MCLAVALAALAARPAAAISVSEARLPGLWERWLADVEAVLTVAEREAFEALSTESEREAFRRHVWADRGDTALERWRRNREMADRLTVPERWARPVVLWAGRAASVEAYGECNQLRSLFIWHWESWHLEAQGAPPGSEAVMVFVQRQRFDPRSFEPWTPGDLESLASPTAASVPALLDAVRAEGCFGRQRATRLRADLERAIGVDELRALTPWPSPAEPPGQPGAAESEPVRLELEFPGAFSRSAIVKGRVLVPLERLEMLPGERLFDRVSIVGDVWAGSRLADSFRITHHVLGAPPGPLVPLDFYRRLRPGAGYRLDLRVADRDGLALLRRQLHFSVPVPDRTAPEPAGNAGGYSQLTRGEVIVLDTFPSVELLPIAAKRAARLRLAAATSGGPIAAVEFRRDGEPLAVVRRPPFTTELAFDAAKHYVEAVALDGAGRVLARHGRWLERAGPPFAVRFEPLPAGAAAAPVSVSLPDGARLARLECFQGRLPTATLTAAPFVCPVRPPAGLGPEYLRVAATLESGDTVEDVLFLGAVAPEHVEVRLVELQVSVVDRRGRPVAGLEAGDFRVRDGGEARPLVSARPLARLPLSVAVVMDASSSMGRRVRLVADSAQRFFEEIVTARDQASLLAFNQDLHRLVPFTGDVKALAYGASGLRARGSTRLRDGIVYALAQFSGLGNRRALIVLSDGADVGSDFPPAQVLDAAVRAGVAVYPIRLGRHDEAAAAELERLAEGSGGTAFQVSSIGELDAVYREIEERLRAQYLLVYEPPRAVSGLDFRPVEVEVLRPGLTTRNVHGYYP